MKTRFRSAVFVLAGVIATLGMGAQAVSAYSFTGGIRPVESNSTHYNYWTYPSQGDYCPTNIYDLRVAISVGTVSSQKVYIKSVTWRFTMGSTDLALADIYAQDNSNPDILYKHSYAPVQPLWSNQTLTFSQTINRDFYFSGGLLKFGADANGAECSSFSTLYLKYVPNTPG